MEFLSFSGMVKLQPDTFRFFCEGVRQFIADATTNLTQSRLQE